jgi:hypothetical protein
MMLDGWLILVGRWRRGAGDMGNDATMTASQRATWTRIAAPAPAKIASSSLMIGGGIAALAIIGLAVELGGDEDEPGDEVAARQAGAKSRRPTLAGRPTLREPSVTMPTSTAGRAPGGASEADPGAASSPRAGRNRANPTTPSCARADSPNQRRRRSGLTQADVDGPEQDQIKVSACRARSGLPGHEGQVNFLIPRQGQVGLVVRHYTCRSASASSMSSRRPSSQGQAVEDRRSHLHVATGPAAHGASIKIGPDGQTWQSAVRRRADGIGRTADNAVKARARRCVLTAA